MTVETLRVFVILGFERLKFPPNDDRSIDPDIGFALQLCPAGHIPCTGTRNCCKREIKRSVYTTVELVQTTVC